MTFGAILNDLLNAVPGIKNAVSTFQSVGHSKETTVQKIGGIVETSATLAAEDIPVPVVQSIAGLVAIIAEGVFGPPTTPPPPAPPPA